MSKHVFTDEQIKELNNNPYVISVTSKYINYSEEFKKLFLKDYNDGMPPIDIFRKYGLNPDLLGEQRRHNFVKRIKRQSQRLDGFKDMRKVNSGRPRTKDLTSEERIAQLNHKINILEQENDFLKRVRSINRRQLLKMRKDSR